MLDARDHWDYLYRLTQFDGDEITIKHIGEVWELSNPKGLISSGKTIFDVLQAGLIQSMKDDAVADQETVYGKGGVPADKVKEINDRVDAIGGKEIAAEPVTEELIP